MLNNETLQGIYDNNCKYLSSLSRMEAIDMCQNLARHTLAIIISDEDVNLFDKSFEFSIQENASGVVEVKWVWENRIRVIINPVNVVVDYYIKNNWHRECIFSTSFLYCFN